MYCFDIEFKKVTLNYFEKIMEKREVKSGMMPSETKWLYSAAYTSGLQHPNYDILELGTLHGYSAFAIAHSIFNLKKHESHKRGGISVNTHIYTVDKHTKTEHSQVSSELGYDNILTFVRSDDVKYLSAQPEKSFSMVWLDSCKEYNHMRETLELVLPKLCINGMICGHDYTWSNYGVIQAVEEWRKQHESSLMAFGVSDTCWWTIKRP